MSTRENIRLIARAPFGTHCVSNGARGQHFGLSLHLHPFYMCANSKGSYARLLVCIGCSEPLLPPYEVRTKISFAGLFLFVICCYEVIMFMQMLLNKSMTEKAYNLNNYFFDYINKWS